MHRRLLLLTRSTRTALAVTILTGVAAGLLTIGQSYLLSMTVSDVFTRNQGLAPLWPWIIGLLSIIVARAALAWVNEVAANGIAVRIKTDLREKLFGHLLALGPAYARGQRTGELVTTAVEGIEALDAYYSQYLPQLVVSTLVPIAILFIVFPQDLLSGIVLLLMAPLIPFFMYMIGRGAEAVTKRQYETLSRLSDHFLDSLQGLTTLKLFGQAKAHARNVAQVSSQYRDATLKVLQVTFLSALALELLATMSTAIIAVEVGLRLLYGHLQFQEALFLLILAPEFYLPLRMLGLRFHAGMAGTTAARRIFEVLDTPTEVPEQSAEDRLSPGRHPRPQAAHCSIELQDVCYSYPGETQPALRNVSLSIKPGMHVALVGPSGAGKTTLASILLRFMRPTSGSLLLDQEPVEFVPLDEWRSLIAWVPQHPHLFQDTIAANIRFGNPDATDEQIAAAARAAHFEEFVRSLPDEYQSQIGEAGARLSSGQAQRLALARAILRDAPILILDEPTSAQDPETEALLEDSTRRLMAGRTVITIAHRLNTVVHADEIIVLEDGSVAQRGTHRELIQQDGPYARAIRAQMLAQQSPIDHEPRSPIAGSYPGQYAERSAAASTQLGTHAFGADDHDGKVFGRLLSFLNGSWGWVGLSVLLSSLTIGSSVALMGTSSWLISSAALHPSIAALEVAIVGVRFFGLSRAVFRYLERLVSHNVTFRLLGRLRSWFYERLEPLAPARPMDIGTGDLLARIIGDVNTLENFYVRVVGPPTTAVLIAAGTAAFVGQTSAWLIAVLVVAFMVLGLALPILVNGLSRRAGQEIITQRAELTARLVDGIQGMADIVAFGQAPARLVQLRAKSLQSAGTQSRLARITGLNTAGFVLISNLAAWLVLLIAVPDVIAGNIPGVMLAPLLLVTLASFEAVAPLPLAAQTWASTNAAARRLFEIVDAEPVVAESVPGRAPDDKRQLPRRIDFADVTFAYPGQRQAALRNVSLTLEPGRKLAIVGPSGSGKSTLASLLLRFWEFECGDIRLDGRSIRRFAPDEVRRQIAFVSANSHFFNTSIYENLRMARRGASRAEVETAARAAQIHHFIRRLPNGYDTMVGECGLRLSGGERQRLAVARAILKDAPLLVLDEPTANLDAVVESELLATLFRLIEGRSCLLITHRLIGLERADEILVLEHGQIIERGSQAELLAQKGPYRRLWDFQNQFLPEAMDAR